MPQHVQIYIFWQAAGCRGIFVCQEKITPLNVSKLQKVGQGIIPKFWFLTVIFLIIPIENEIVIFTSVHLNPIWGQFLVEGREQWFLGNTQWVFYFYRPIFHTLKIRCSRFWDKEALERWSSTVIRSYELWI